MTRVLVTGATGFLGSHLARRLAAGGHEVHALARPGSGLEHLKDLPVRRVEGDLSDAGSLDRAAEGCEVVFHAAAVLGFRKGLDQLQQEVNVLGTRRVCRAALRAGVRRLVHVSSVAAVGIPEEGSIADESTPFTREAERTAYARTKHAAEIEVLEALEDGLDAVTVNPGVIFGIRPNRHHTLNLLETLAAGRLPAYPTGGTCWVWVEDVVGGILLAWEKGRRARRYILGGENLPYRVFMRTVCRAAGSRPPLLPMPGPLLRLGAGLLGRLSPISAEAARLSARRLYYDSGLARRELGWRQTPLEEAVRTCLTAWTAP